MAWTSPRTWVTSEIVTAALLNAHVRDNLLFLKSGVASNTQLTADPAATSGTTELTVATSGSITFDGSTLVEVAFSWYSTTLTVSTDTYQCRVYDGATQVGAIQFVGAQGGMCRGVITPSAGSHTFTGRVVRIAGTGTCTMRAFATAPIILTVRQVT